MRLRSMSGALALGSALAMLRLTGLLSPQPAFALAGQEFVVAGDDGYGIADCMKPGSECGRVMADAWCQAHGHGHADTFGLADDLTGSTNVKTVDTAPIPADAVIIRCGD